MNTGPIYLLLLNIHQIFAVAMPIVPVIVAQAAEGEVPNIDEYKLPSGRTQPPTQYSANSGNRLAKRTDQHLNEAVEEEMEHAQAQGIEVDCPICLQSMTTEQLTTSCGHEFHRDCLSSWLESHLTCPLCRTTIRERDTFDRLIARVWQDWEYARESMFRFTTRHDWIFPPEIIDMLVPKSHQSSSTYRYFRNASEIVYLVMQENDDFVKAFIRRLRRKQIQYRDTKYSKFVYWMEKTKALFKFKHLLADLETSWQIALQMAVHAQFLFATGRQMTAYEAQMRERIRKPRAVTVNSYALFLGRLRELQDASNECNNPEEWTYYLREHYQRSR